MQERRSQLPTNGRCPLKKNTTIILFVSVSLLHHISPSTPITTPGFICTPFWGQYSRSPALSLTLLRRVGTFLGYGFRLSNFLLTLTLTPASSKHCRNRSPITMPPHPPPSGLPRVEKI